LTETEFTTQIENPPYGEAVISITSIHNGFSSFKSNPVLLEFDSRGKF